MPAMLAVDSDQSAAAQFYYWDADRYRRMPEEKPVTRSECSSGQRMLGSTWLITDTLTGPTGASWRPQSQRRLGSINIFPGDLVRLVLVFSPTDCGHPARLQI